MKVLWTALVELLTPPSESGDTMCFTNVVAWAESPDDYAASLATLFGKSDCSVLSIERCLLVDDGGTVSEELSEQIARAREHPDDCIFGELHYYPSKPA